VPSNLGSLLSLSGVSTTDDPVESLSNYTTEDYDQYIGIAYDNDDADYGGEHCTHVLSLKGYGYGFENRQKSFHPFT